MSSCSISGSSPESVLLGITTVTTVGIERWQEEDVAVELRATTTRGFPALIAQPRQYDDYCSVEVDVAVGQLLDVQYGVGSLAAQVSQDELCRRAEQSAEQAVATLLQR